jgi:hypothetical protein
MFNAEKPSLNELPTSRQLLRSTFAAFIGAIIILVVIILPAEYGIDPTGAGRMLNLTEMGEIKQELSKEAKRDHGANLPRSEDPGIIDRLISAIIGTAHAQEKRTWADEVRFTLKPGDTHELKLKMEKGEVAYFRMVVEGGRVNFDLHAHSGGKSITYEKGRGSTGSEGKIIAAFGGKHGWFWRNRDKKALTVTLKLRGSYSAIKQSN